MQLDPAFSLRLRFDEFDQIQNIARRGRTIVRDEIPMLKRHHRTANFCPLQAKLLNKLTRRNHRRVLETAPRARRRWLRIPTLVAENAHALLHFFTGRHFAFEHCAKRDVIFQQRATAILGFDFRS